MQAMQDKVSVHMSLLLLLVRYGIFIHWLSILIVDFEFLHLVATPGKYSGAGSRSGSFTFRFIYTLEC